MTIKDHYMSDQKTPNLQEPDLQELFVILTRKNRIFEN